MKLTRNTSIINAVTLFQALKTYMNHRTDRIKQEIMDKISHFCQIIARHRQRSSLAKKTVDVSPQITVNVLHHALNTDELAHLSRGKIFTFKHFDNYLFFVFQVKVIFDRIKVLFVRTNIDKVKYKMI